jgi:hypothetical protein
MCFSFLYFPVDVPDSLVQILDCIMFEICTPDIFDGVTQTEPHVFCDPDALNTARVRCVVLWMAYWVSHVFF